MGWLVLFGVACAVLCFYFPRGYNWGLAIAAFAIAIYDIITSIRVRRALEDLDRIVSEIEKESE